MKFTADEESGLQTDTAGDAPHVTRKMVIRAPGREFDLTFEMPRAVDAALLDEDWDFCEERINGVFPTMLASYLLNGRTSAECMEKVRERLLDALYRKFQDRQAEAGNKRWIVPSSMQKVKVYE